MKILKITMIVLSTLLTNTCEVIAKGFPKASYYGKKFHGKKTANGEIFNMKGLTAASNKFPFNTMLKVTNKLNNKSVVVRINDRGNLHGRVLDLSMAAAKKIDMLKRGIVPIKIEVI